MKIYTVGGAVRDRLLGLPIKDRDYVVVGSNPAQMLDLGYKPVGSDFPVFLHPTTHEEYALARTERKTAPGYKGFVFHAAPDVTLEQDLARRDLTINAIAEDANGVLIDPFGGERDLRDGVLRHVSGAFIEDPVRILRVARFAARFNFRVADETRALMKTMVANGEIDALVAERVWQELAKGLMTEEPSRLFAVLRDCGALAKILPEVNRLFGVPQSATSHPEIDTGVQVMMVIDYAAKNNYSLPIRFAALTHDLGKGSAPTEQLPKHPGHEFASVALLKALCERIKVPNDCRDLAVATARWHGAAHSAMTLGAEGILRLIEGTDALRRPTRFNDFLLACECDHAARLGFENTPYPQRLFLQAALKALQALDMRHLTQSVSPEKIPETLRSAKIKALQQFIESKST